MNASKCQPLRDCEKRLSQIATSSCQKSQGRKTDIDLLKRRGHRNVKALSSRIARKRCRSLSDNAVWGERAHGSQVFQLRMSQSARRFRFMEWRPNPCANIRATSLALFFSLSPR